MGRVLTKNSSSLIDNLNSPIPISSWVCFGTYVFQRICPIHTGCQLYWNNIVRRNHSSFYSCLICPISVLSTLSGASWIMRLLTLSQGMRMITGSTYTLRIVPSILFRWFPALNSFLTNICWLVLSWRFGWDSANLCSLSMKLSSLVLWLTNSSCPVVRFPECWAPSLQLKIDSQWGAWVAQ